MQPVKDDVPREARHTLRMLGRLLAPHWRKLLGIAGFGVAAALMTMATAIVNRAVVDRFAGPGAVVSLTALWGLLLVGAGVLAWISSWITFRVGRAVAGPLADDVFERLTRQSLREHEDNDAAEGQTLVTRCIEQIGTTLSIGLSWLVSDIAHGVGALLGVTLIDWRYGVAMSPLVVVAWFSARWMGRRQERLVGKQIEHDKRRIELTAEVLEEDRFPFVKRNVLEDRFVAEFAAATDAHEAVLRERRVGFTLYTQALTTLPLLAAPVAWTVGSMSGASAGTVVSIAALLPQVMLAMNGIAGWHVRMADNAAYLHRALRVVQQPPAQEPAVDDSIRRSDLAGQPLVLDHVVCTRGDRQVLRGLDLVVSAGSYVAVVGPNGAGKSTLFNVITGLLPSEGAGSVRFGSIPLSRVPRRLLAEHVRAVDSTPLAFSGSVLDNVTMLAPEASEEEIARACAIAQIEFPLDTVPGKLSTGQRIQMLVAQAVLTRPGVLLLDEGLKHLHATTRRNLRTAVRRALPDAAIFEVSHEGAVRAEVVTRIVVLDDGVIAESGTHDELMRIVDGRYATAVADSQR